jgi:chemotaxis protein methyltransferase CheR
MTMVDTAADALRPEHFAYVSNLVREQAAIVLDRGKEYLVESRLRPLAEKAGFASLGALVDTMMSKPSLHLEAKVIEAMTTNETSFFRDAHPFEALMSVVLPEAIKANADAKRLRIWCGASSTGQEPYTIAMVLRHHFPQLNDWDVKILCTDLSEEVLVRTREGKYSQLEVNRGLPAQMLVRWFSQHGVSWQAKPELRDLLDVRPLNLVGAWPLMGPFDVVFLRNVLIYFAPEDKAKVLGRVAAALKPGGALFLGAAETTLGMSSAFTRRTEGQASWYSRT